MTIQIYLDPCTVNSRKVLAGLDLIGIKVCSYTTIVQRPR